MSNICQVTWKLNYDLINCRRDSVVLELKSSFRKPEFVEGEP